MEAADGTRRDGDVANGERVTKRNRQERTCNVMGRGDVLRVHRVDGLHDDLQAKQFMELNDHMKGNVNDAVGGAGKAAGFGMKLLGMFLKK